MAGGLGADLDADTEAEPLLPGVPGGRVESAVGSQGVQRDRYCRSQGPRPVAATFAQWAGLGEWAGLEERDGLERWACLEEKVGLDES